MSKNEVHGSVNKRPNKQAPQVKNVNEFEGAGNAPLTERGTLRAAGHVKANAALATALLDEAEKVQTTGKGNGLDPERSRESGQPHQLKNAE